MKVKELIKIIECEPEKEISLSVSDVNKQIFCESIFEITIQDKITIVADISEEQCNLLPSELLKQNKQMREMLEKVVRLKDLIEYTGYISVEHKGEAQAVNGMLAEIEQFLTPKN